MSAKGRKKIIFVDDQVSNLMIGRNVLSTDYDVFTVPSAEKMFELIKKISPDLILLDVEMRHERVRGSRKAQS